MFYGIMRGTPLAAAFLVASLTGCSLFWPNTLTVVVEPPGAGTYTLNPRRGIYANGERVTVSVSPAGDFSLHAFVVDGQPVESAGDKLSLSVAQDTTVTAVFSTGSYGLLVAPTETGAEVSVNVGPSPSDVYLIFTNVGESAHALPVVPDLSGNVVPPQRLAARPSSVLPVYRRPAAVRGHPVTRAYAEEGRRRLATARRGGRGVSPPPLPLPDVVGDANGFYYDTSDLPIAAHCRLFRTVAGTTISIWVADASWTDGADEGQLNQAMIDALSDKFLSDGVNGIYGWVRGIYGDEWGSHDYPQDLIGDNDTVTILLYDIDDDGTAPLDPEGDGGIAGFFWPKDNYLNFAPYLDYSNERLMFYIDAPMLAARDGTDWEITDWWPEEVLSTLAHEFQHMIHFYQKDVLRNFSGGEVWLNEMCSMVAEDLVSGKLGVPGPRAVDPVEWEGTAGGTTNQRGFLPIYNWDNFHPVDDWPAADVVGEALYAAYAVNYAFGAYLARNYGGAALFRAIVQNGSSGRDAIDAALSTVGSIETFGSALRQWAVANLLSDGYAAPPYQYNTGGWIDAGFSGPDYRLGSIDLYRYRYEYYDETSASYRNWDGPYVWGELPTFGLEGSASLYYLAATDATGVVSFALAMDPDMRLEIAIKR